MLKKISQIVQKVGYKLLEWREQKIFTGIWQQETVKATVDRLAHDMLVTELLLLDAMIPVISEEDEASLVQQRPTLYWLIDPIDGTASFIKGFSGFVTQIALMQNNRPIITAVYAPLLKTLYTAELGQGSFCNNNRLQICTKTAITTLIDNYPEPRGSTLCLFNDLNFSYYVESGSIALKICKVADNSAHVFFKDVAIRDWDIAAPQLILEEAGGFLSKLNGEKFTYTGSYQHTGLIATTSIFQAQKVVDWYRKFDIEQTEHKKNYERVSV